MTLKQHLLRWWDWLCDEHATPDEFRGYVALVSIPELPASERDDPLGLYTHTEAPSSAIVWRCPVCGLPVAENAFNGHLESHRQDVWNEFYDTLDLDWSGNGELKF